MNGWIALVIYVSIDLTATIGLFIYKNNLEKKRAKQPVITMNFPAWVNKDIDDPYSEFNKIIARLNHPTYRQE